MVIIHKEFLEVQENISELWLKKTEIEQIK